MACADISMNIQEAEESVEDDNDPVINYYVASKLLPGAKGPLHDLLQKQPAVVGFLQIMTGIFSIGVGILFAITLPMNMNLCTLFRVSHLTGFLVMIAGILSSLLFRCPRLLPVCFSVNIGCIIAGAVGWLLIIVDMAVWYGEPYYKMEMLELSVLCLDTMLSVLLCVLYYKEIYGHAHTEQAAED